ncbi:MAG: zf-TFIIB domain-containing protein [Actinomycetota bacterium]|nr:zf-TFIIB domain-containing protein [Actinomycetota bacterium]
MNCPVDNELLQMTERQGVEVDYCPRCRGVWLDRGELDKILERAGEELSAASGRRRDDHDDDDDRYRPGPYRDDRSRYDDDDRDRGGLPYRGRKKKRSFMSDIFEFGD